MNDARRGDDFIEIEFNEAREQQFENLDEDDEFFSTDSEEQSDSIEDDGLRKGFLLELKTNLWK